MGQIYMYVKAVSYMYIHCITYTMTLHSHHRDEKNVQKLD